MSDMLKQRLTDDVTNWERVGHPALLERFVVRQGETYLPMKLDRERGEPKQCFMNAARLAMHDPHLTYVEGFALHREHAFLPILHAWVTQDDEHAIDVTLQEPEDYDYVGVAFDLKTLVRELRKTGVYGLLDPGVGLNTRLMFKIDPTLKKICDAVKRQPRFACSQ